MRDLPLAALLVTLAACRGEPPPAGDPRPTSPQVPARVPPGEAAPADGRIGFGGFGPAGFGSSAKQVRMAWGGELGGVPPDRPGGCQYLVPQPQGRDGYKVAFMIEADRLVRIDVDDPAVVAPGGGRIGMTRAQLATLYSDIEERPHKYTDGLYLRIRDPAGGSGVLLFETDGTGDAARIGEWRVGLAPQIDYVEGCS